MYGLLLVCLCSTGLVNSAVDSSPGNKIEEGGLSCSDLLLGQYLCDEPEINTETQQARECDPDTKTVQVSCRPAVNITCGGILHNGTTVGFNKSVPCKWTNGHKFETALLLSIFLGMFGIDRFYLGYPAMGLVKFATLGFMFLGQLIDILLIATQVVKPSDGSDYVIDYYGAATTRVMMDNATRLKVQIDGGV